MSKPREWNLVIYGVSNPHGHIQPVRTWLGEEITEETKVIVYSAYEKLQKQNEIMREALKYIRGDHKINIPEIVQSGFIIAREALAKIEKDEV